MPIPAKSGPQSQKSCTPKPREGVPLPVLPAPKRSVRKSKMGPWRAAVLLLVNLAIIGHITLWVVTGMRETLSPVEPSEAMYTLERGLVNAGFVFFALAILSTLVLGRFFCGWGCHVVALQDLCGWAMKKLGIRPKPFRTRLLIAAPLLLAIYMFVWPTLQREVVKPWAVRSGSQTLAAYFSEVPEPVFRSRDSASSFFRPELKKKDFWETFPPWYIAVPFLGICGFATVYFLGAKGFCTYGCPYGGFFGPADKLAVGRIRVTDACEHCGHCTSVCTSNVRVHEEVRDYGMVIDPGCMKCMDCISVCPNDALYFGLGKPALLARPRTEKPQSRFKNRVYDLSISEEIAAGIVFFLLFYGFRGMFNGVPLLMAMGIAAIGAFLFWKLLSLVRQPSVRIQNLQLKLKGSLKPAGLAFGALAILTLTAGAWGVVVNASREYGGILDVRVHTPYEKVFAPGYTPDPADKALALRAIAHITRAGPRTDGGIGWRYRQPAQYTRMAWLSAVAGDLPAAESNIRKAIAFAAEFPEGPTDDLLNGLANVIGLQGRPQTDIFAAYRDLLAAARNKPGAAPLMLIDARLDLASGQTDQGLAKIESAAAGTDQARILIAASQILAEAGHLPRALEHARRAADLEPRNPFARLFLANVHLASNQPDAALAQLDAAAKLDPRNPHPHRVKAQVLHAMGRPAEAAAAEARARELESAATPR